MSLVDIVPAKLTHVGPIASRMRAVDRLEASAFGLSPRQALRRSWRGSTMRMTALANGRPIAMFGMVPLSLIEGRGAPWMLGTEDAYSFGREMLVLGAEIIAVMIQTCPNLSNVVAASNSKAIRLLSRWGFTVDDAIDTVGGVQLRRFQMERGRS